MNELAFPAMGTQVSLLAKRPEGLADVRDGLLALARRLSRFEPGSELCALNADARGVVPVSPLLARAVAAALLAAQRTGGLVDPTLLDALEQAGYVRSRTGVAPASLPAALAAAPRAVRRVRASTAPGGRLPSTTQPA